MTSGDSTRTDAPVLSVGVWHVDPARSELGFATRMMFGIPVRGRFTQYDGTLTVDKESAAHGTLRIETETISTGIKRRDRHLRTSDFFAVERHPQMVFELDDLVSEIAGTVKLVGTLNIRDQKLPISTPVTLVQEGIGSAKLTADFEIDHNSAGFEFKHLPKSVNVKVDLTLVTTP